MNRTDYLLAGLIIISGHRVGRLFNRRHGVDEASGATAQQARRGYAAPPPLTFTVRTDATAGGRLIPAVVSVEITAVVLARRDGLLTWLGGGKERPWCEIRSLLDSMMTKLVHSSVRPNWTPAG
jgi:hypothetical protein